MRRQKASWAGMFAREIQAKPQPMIKRFIIVQSWGEGGVGNKQPADFMEITKMETWNCRPLQLSYVRLYGI